MKPESGENSDWEISVIKVADLFFFNITSDDVCASIVSLLEDLNMYV